jgi:hypothetical protein
MMWSADYEYEYEYEYDYVYEYEYDVRAHQRLIQGFQIGT